MQVAGPLRHGETPSSGVSQIEQTPARSNSDMTPLRRDAGIRSTMVLPESGLLRSFRARRMPRYRSVGSAARFI